MIEKTRLREDKPISGFRESWFNSLSIGPRDARGDIGNVFANVFLGRPFPGQGPLLLSRYQFLPFIVVHETLVLCLNFSSLINVQHVQSKIKLYSDTNITSLSLKPIPGINF